MSTEQNKLIKTLTDSAVLVGISSGIGYVAKKMLKENFLGDPSSNVMNYAKLTVVFARYDPPTNVVAFNTAPPIIIAIEAIVRYYYLQ